MVDRFDKFTERARQVLTFAQEEATGLHQTYIAPEHILLGLVRIEDALGTTILSNLGVEAGKVRVAVGTLIAGRVPRTDVPPGLTPTAKKVVALAVEEAQRLRHRYIGTEHLLLGLLREGESGAFSALEVLGVTYADARLEVTKLVASGPPPRRDPATRMVEEIRGTLQPDATTVRPIVVPPPQYRVETQWGGLFGGSVSSEAVEGVINRRRAEGWHLVTAIPGFGFRWLIPRGKLTYVWEQLPALQASRPDDLSRVNFVIGEERD